jgi:hypothetical protein
MVRVDTAETSLQLALRLLREAKVGVAPGTAFGPEGEGCIRMCFAISTEFAHEAVVGLTRFFGLAAQPTFDSANPFAMRSAGLRLRRFRRTSTGLHRLTIDWLEQRR